MSVEAGVPDTVCNGIVLSGTVHWMFDRGLISLSGAGDILLSRRSNDVEGVEPLIFWTARRGYRGRRGSRRMRGIWRGTGGSAS